MAMEMRMKNYNQGNISALHQLLSTHEYEAYVRRSERLRTVVSKKFPSGLCAFSALSREPRLEIASCTSAATTSAAAPAKLHPHRAATNSLGVHGCVRTSYSDTDDIQKGSSMRGLQEAEDTVRLRGGGVDLCEVQKDEIGMRCESQPSDNLG